MHPGGTDSAKSLSKLRGRLARGDGFTAVRLDGVIDEHNELAEMLEPIGQGDKLLVDLGGIKRLNSVGVRDWVNWLRALRPRFKQIVLFDCPPPVMSEVNFVKNFAEGAFIATFAVPLFCPSCNKEESRILETQALRVDGQGGRVRLPGFACEKPVCANAIDDDEESYFAFLDSLPPSPDPDRLRQLTALARTAVAQGQPLEKAPPAGHPHQPAPRLVPLGAIGHAPQGSSPTAATSATTPPASAAVGDLARAEAPPGGRGDWLFIAAMVAMVAVLGTLVYLILTLE